MKDRKTKHYLDKDYIFQNIFIKYRTVAAFTRAYGISRTRFYEILNTEYVKKNSAAVVRLCDFLKISINVVWR